MQNHDNKQQQQLARNWIGIEKKKRERNIQERKICEKSFFPLFFPFGLIAKSDVYVVWGTKKRDFFPSYDGVGRALR